MKLATFSHEGKTSVGRVIQPPEAPVFFKLPTCVQGPYCHIELQRVMGKSFDYTARSARGSRHPTSSHRSVGCA